MVERVPLSSVEGRRHHAENLVQDVTDGAELVKFNGHLTLQVRDDHTDTAVDRLQWLQLQLTL